MYTKVLWMLTNVWNVTFRRTDNSRSLNCPKEICFNSQQCGAVAWRVINMTEWIWSNEYDRFGQFNWPRCVHFSFNLFFQYFIFMCVSDFGPLPCSIITTTRKFFTVLVKNTCGPNRWRMSLNGYYLHPPPPPASVFATNFFPRQYFWALLLH